MLSILNRGWNMHLNQLINVKQDNKQVLGFQVKHACTRMNLLMQPDPEPKYTKTT